MFNKVIDDSNLGYLIGKIKAFVYDNRDNISTVTTQEDGTMVITLSNGDTVTVDLNHTHPGTLKYVLCADEAEYNAITNKDSGTLYLIPETSS